MDGIIALAQSKRFWMVITGLIVVFGNVLFGLKLDPQSVLATLMLLSAWIIGETNRPAVRKTGLRLFNPPAAIMLLALAMTVGCARETKPSPTPAPQPLSAVEVATESQIRTLASGFADAFKATSDRITSGEITDTAKMREALVAATRDARLSAELSVLDEMNDRFPQNDVGDWSDRESVVKYLRSISDGYRRVAERLRPELAR